MKLKKWISLLLVCAMLCSVLPVTATAEPEPEKDDPTLSALAAAESTDPEAVEPETLESPEAPEADDPEPIDLPAEPDAPAAIEPEEDDPAELEPKATELETIAAEADAENISVSTWDELQTALNNAAYSDPIVLTQDITAPDGASALTVSRYADARLNLNGHTIDRGLSGGTPVKNGSVFIVNGALEIDGPGTITGGNTNGTGGGVWVKSTGQFTLIGGTITGNFSKNIGGGVYVSGSGACACLQGGTITGNTAKNGGGVGQDGGGVIRLWGSSVTNNTATNNGGGIWYGGGSGASLSLRDGAISGNTAENKGGGLFLNGGAGSMQDGVSITNNSAVNGGGVYINNGTFDWQGGTIQGNTATTNSEIGPAGSAAVPTYTVTVDDASHGTVTADKTGSVCYGEVVTLTVAPDEGYYLKSLSVTDANDSSVSVVNNAFSMPRSNVTVSARFEQLQRYDIDVDYPHNAGTISYPYDAVVGTLVTITATPDAERVTASLTVLMDDGDNRIYQHEVPGVNHPDPNTITFPMPSANVTAYATFSDSGQKRVFICDLAGGTIIADKNLAAYGDTVTLTIQPDNGYAYEAGSLSIKEVDSYGNEHVFGGNIDTVAANSVYTFTMGSDTVYVSASFTPLPAQTRYSVLIDEEIEYGTVQTDLLSAEAGWRVTLTPVVDEIPALQGYVLKSLTVSDANGSAIETTAIGNGRYRFLMPEGNVFVMATFDLPVYPITVQTNRVEINADEEAQYNDPVSFWYLLPNNTTLESLTVTGDTTGTDYSGRLTLDHTDGSSVYRYRFTMPNEPVTIRAAFIVPTYTVSVAEGTPGTMAFARNGEAVTAPFAAAYGDALTVTYTPPEGTVLNQLQSTFAARTVNLVTTESNGVYTADVYMRSTDMTFTASTLSYWKALQRDIAGAHDGDTIALRSDTVAAADDTQLAFSGLSLTLDLNGYTLNRNRTTAAEDGSVIRVASGANLTIIDSSQAGTGTIRGGYANSGGAIYNAGTVTVTGGTITGNHSNHANNHHNGGAIYNAGTLSMTGTTVSGNDGDDGGAIYNAAGGTLTLENVTISGNGSVNHGGGALVNYGTASMEICTLSNNTATGNGGAIWTNSALTLNSCEIMNNTSASYGGAIYVNGGTLNATLTTFIGNTSTDGGAIYVNSGTTATLTQVTIQNNTTTVHGGGGITNYGAVHANGLTITGNTSTGNGGGIWVNGTFTVRGFISIKNNEKEAAANNVFLMSGKLVTLSGALETGSEIFVTTQNDLPVTLTSGWTTYMGSANTYTYIASDAGHNVNKRNDEAVICAYYVTGTTRHYISDFKDIADLDGNSTLTSGWYVLMGEKTYHARLDIPAGTVVNLNLMDGCTLTCEKGIRVAPYNGTACGQLHIYGQENQNGTLIAAGEQYQAGIGGNDNEYNGAIEIRGGTVRATGGEYAAGIGSGDDPTAIAANISGTITYGGVYIDGATVTATGGDEGAGIGGGNNGKALPIIISGNSTVTATGGRLAAGIGGGDSKGLYGVEISGSVITATGGENGAGIGGGERGDQEGEITIIELNRLSLTATGGYKAAAIGGGEDGNGGTVKILRLNEGSITLSVYKENGSYIGSYIGAGYGGSDDGSLSFSGNYGSSSQYLAADNACVTIGNELKTVRDNQGNDQRAALLHGTAASTAVVAACTHPGEHIYLYLGDPYHAVYCQYCWKLLIDGQSHTKDEHNRCTLCGHQWPCTVTFAGGGGSGSMNTASVEIDGSYTLPACSFTAPSGKSFFEWSVKIGSAAAVSKQPGDTITVSANTTVTAIWTWTEPRITNHSLVLSGQIGVDFYVKLPAGKTLNDYLGLYVTFAGDHIDGTAHYDLPAQSTEINGVDYGYKVTVMVTSIQMAEQITPTIHYTENETEKTVTGAAYSVKDYVDYVTANSAGLTAAELNIVKALADYGHYAQQYLSAQNHWEIGTDYAEMKKHFTDAYTYETVKTAVAEKQLVKTLGSTLSDVKYNLRLDDEISINVKLFPKEGVTISSITLNGNSVALNWVNSDGGYYLVTIPHIKASVLSDTYTVSVNDATVTVSPLSYVYSALSLGDGRENIKNLCCALYYFAEACKQQ